MRGEENGVWWWGAVWRFCAGVIEQKGSEESESGWGVRKLEHGHEEKMRAREAEYLVVDVQLLGSGIMGSPEWTPTRPKNHDLST